MGSVLFESYGLDMTVSIRMRWAGRAKGVGWAISKREREDRAYIT
jgi:hypothetical protein